MMECNNISNCPFFKYCNDLNLNNSIKGFINKYCNGNMVSECIRLKLSLKYGKSAVPKNMMPNGMPIPGTDKSDWSREALEHRYLL